MGDRAYRISFLSLAAIFAFTLLSIPSFGASRLRAKRQQSAQQNRTKKVWTNADLDQLRDRDAISIVGVGSEEPVPPEPAPAAQGAKQKVWTNDDLQKLGQISLVPSAEQTPPQTAPSTVPPSAAAPAPGSAEAAPYSRFTDPNWYAEMAEHLRVQLNEREFALFRYEEGIAAAKDRISQPGIDLFGGDVGITPEGGVQNLETGVGQALIEIEDLMNLARHNDIPPGVLRN